MDSTSDLAAGRILPPRVHSEFGPELLTEVLSELLEQNTYKVVALQGHGCSCALQFVQAWADTHYLSISTTDGWLKSSQSLHVAKLRLTARSPGPPHLTLTLSGWTRDEYIDYLLRFHPTECKRVMASLRSVDIHFADGSPFVWQPYLDWLAAHAEPIEPWQFIYDRMVVELGDQDKLSSVIDNLLAANEHQTTLLTHTSAAAERWLRLDDVQLKLQAQRLTDDIRQCKRQALFHRWPSELLKATARNLMCVYDQAFLDNMRTRGEWDRLNAFLRVAASKSRYSATAVSLLAKLDPQWKPEMRKPIELKSADLRGVRWAGCKLPSARMVDTQLSDADLRGADLRKSVMRASRFQRAALQDVQMQRVQGSRVVFADADLTRGSLTHSRFARSDFSRTCLRDADCSNSNFVRSNLQGSQLHGSNFHRTVMEDVDMEGAQLDRARFTAAFLVRVKFKDASLRGVDFRDAEFSVGSDLEQLDLSHCNFEGVLLKGAYLTDSVARNACFKLAELPQAGLAGVVWENCDLRGADLRGAAFHMGSTRCGLVDSPYSSHGTRTGFYTDDYVDLSYKHPEQVRKAALIGCDLRGALLQGCDFYLVDVRDCWLDPDQRELMAACGAILE